MAAKKKAVAPVPVNNMTRRSGDDALEGHFVDVVDGEHAGRRGAFEKVEESDPKTGYPHRIIVRTRDARAELLAVLYEHVRPAQEYFGGR